MAEGTTLAVGALALGALGVYLYQKSKAPAPLPPTNSNPSANGPGTIQGYVIPDNVSTQVQGAWSARTGNKETGPGDFIAAAQGIIPLSYNVWQSVYAVWEPFYRSAGQWPNDATFRGWITTAIANYG